MSEASGDDPLDPKRWTARGGEGGPITGDEFAYLKDLVHRQMGVGNREPDHHADPVPKRSWIARLLARFRRR